MSLYMIETYLYCAYVSFSMRYLSYMPLLYAAFDLHNAKQLPLLKLLPDILKV